MQNLSSFSTLNLVYTFALLNALASAIWGGSILSSYVYLVTESSVIVGGLLAMSGIAQLTFSPVVGYVADKVSKHFVLRMAGILGIVCAVLTLLVLLTDNFYGLYGCMFGWGIYWGATVLVIDAVIADAVPSGERSIVYTTRFTMQNYGGCVGPIVAMAMFLSLGNHWTYFQCKFVICCGLIISLIPSITLTLFSLEENKSGDGAMYAAVATDPSDEEAVSQGIHKQDSNTQDAQLTDKVPSNVYFAPRMMVASDIIASIAAGMSFGFFPIFFMAHLEMSPVFITAIYMVFPVGLSKSALMAQKIGVEYGRIFAIVSTKCVGLIFFLLFILLSYWKQNIWLILIAFVVRVSVMNSSRPLSKSILMDLVNPSERSRWSSLEAINNATWCGSSFVGGFVIRQYGMINLFLLTALLQFIALIPLVFIWPYVPNEVPDGVKGGTSSPVHADDGCCPSDEESEFGLCDPFDTKEVEKCVEMT